MRIVLVGDDASLSAELLEYIADLGDEWHVQSVVDGNTAIATVASSTVDAVIVAPALPDLVPATLLGQIRTLRPETIRTALIDAGQSQRVPSARIIGVAHRSCRCRCRRKCCSKR